MPALFAIAVPVTVSNPMHAAAESKAERCFDETTIFPPVLLFSDKLLLPPVGFRQLFVAPDNRILMMQEAPLQARTATSCLAAFERTAPTS